MSAPLGHLVIVAIAAGVIASSGCSVETKPDKYGAESVCEDFVKDRLKSPGSAHFSGRSTEGSGKNWTVTGNVDSENSFGASIRNTFVCKVRATDAKGENWHLEDLQMSGN